MNKKEFIIGENIYTVELSSDIQEGEPFLYKPEKTKKMQVIIAENGINVHNNLTHFAIIGMRKKNSEQNWVHAFYNEKKKQLLFVSHPDMKLHQLKKYSKYKWLGSADGNEIAIEVLPKISINIK